MKKRRRLPGVLTMLAALLLMLNSGEPRSVAVGAPSQAPESPGLQLVMPEETVQPTLKLPEAEKKPPAETPREEVPPVEERPVEEDTPVKAEPWTPEPVPAEKKILRPAAKPIPAGEPVEDTYFENTAFFGDSRTEGLELFGGLKTATYYHAVGATVKSVFMKTVRTATVEEDGSAETEETVSGTVISTSGTPGTPAMAETAEDEATREEPPLLDTLAEQETELKRVYVMLGINELGWSRTELFRQQYGLLIDRLREDHPGADIVLQSILPVTAKWDEMGGYVNNRRIAIFNGIITELAAEKNCRFLNVAELVTDENGCLREDWTNDGVHLTAEGCRAWVQYLRTHAVEE